MFKVGDKVEVKRYGKGWDGEGVAEDYYDGRVIVKFNREFPRNRGSFPPQYVHKIGNPSPIRTMTRREIVPGTYGRVKVTGIYGSSRVTLDWEGGASIQTAVPIVGMTAEELREAAHILNQLAEALEDNP